MKIFGDFERLQVEVDNPQEDAQVANWKIALSGVSLKQREQGSRFNIKCNYESERQFNFIPQQRVEENKLRRVLGWLTFSRPFFSSSGIINSIIHFNIPLILIARNNFDVLRSEWEIVKQKFNSYIIFILNLIDKFLWNKNSNSINCRRVFFSIFYMIAKVQSKGLFLIHSLDRGWNYRF